MGTRDLGGETKGDNPVTAWEAMNWLLHDDGPGWENIPRNIEVYLDSCMPPADYQGSQEEAFAAELVRRVQLERVAALED